MKPFKKILVPVDFSSSSRDAIATAADLSARYGADLCVLHVYEPINYVLPPNYPMLHSTEQHEKILIDYGNHLAAAKKEAEAAGALRVETQQLQGTPATEIVEFAQKRGCDLIVMGTHGRTGLQHALLGSVTEKVMRKAPCPVLTVRITDS